MDAMKHTPGPWHDQCASMCDCSLVVTGCGITICKLRDGSERSYDDEDATAMANASLIAAAPDLLEACRQMLMQMEIRFGTTTQADEFEIAAMDDARAAIGKAEGNPQ